MPADSSSRFALLDQLAEEFAERYRRGERPPLQEYIDRHPELADDIREYFPSLVQIEQVEADRGAGRPACQPASGEQAARPLPRQVGDYAVLREIGRGGMGVVYEAEQQSLGRRVALKVLPVSVAKDDKALERFRREARAAAKLHHTNIVPVFEVGQDGDVCFYAMQFIQGQPLDEVVDELQRLRRASGGRQPPVAEALAKQQGADAPRSPGSHRVAESLLTGRFQAQALTTPGTVEEVSLPVDNGSTMRLATNTAVLPGQTDIASVEANRQPYYQSVARIGQQVANALTYAHQRGVIHRDIKPSNLLLDAAGVVWVTDFGLAKTEESSLTEAGEILGTLRYLAPERFRAQCDLRSDVYALGLTLYELLTLRPAFDCPDRLRLIESIYTQEPPRPRSLDPHIPRDLETVVLKATDKDPARRYQTAEDMADDLQRFLADEPIKARRTSLTERVARWCRRNPVVASLTLAVAAMAIVSTTAAIALSAALADSEGHRREANANLWEAHLAHAEARRMSHRVGQRFDSLDAIRKALALPVPPGHSLDELRNEAIACMALPDLRPVRDVGRWTWPGPGDVSKDIDTRHERYAVADRNGNVSVRRVADDEELYRLPGFDVRADVGVTFHRNGTFVRVHNWPQLWVKVWKLDGPEPVLLIDDRSGALGPTDFSPDGRQVVCGWHDGRITLVDVATGKSRTLSYRLQDLRMLACHPDGRQFAAARTGGGRHTLSVHSLDDGTMHAILDVHAQIDHIAWHPHGQRLAAAGQDSRIYLWEVGKPRQPRVLEGCGNSALTLQFSAQGDVLVSNGWEGVLRFWDPHTGQQLLNQPASGYVRFSSDGRFIPVQGKAAHFQIAEFARGEYRTLVRNPALGKEIPRENYRRPVVSPDGRLLGVGLEQGVGLWDLATGDQVAYLEGQGRTEGPSFDAEGRMVTYGPASLLRWPVTTTVPGSLQVGPPRTLVEINPVGAQVVSSQDGRAIALANFQRGALVWLEGPPSRFVELGPQSDVRCVALTPDGRWAVTATYGSPQQEGVKLWEAESGRLVKTLSEENGQRVAMSPDGRWLAVSNDKSCQLWEVAGWTQGRTFSGAALAFTADGETLAVREGHTIRLIHPANGREYARLEDPNQDRANHATFTPDGAQLITTGWETHPIHVWDLRLIRRGLKELNLDWDAPELPAAPPPAPPIRVRVDTGGVKNPR